MLNAAAANLGECQMRSLWCAGLPAEIAEMDKDLVPKYAHDDLEASVHSASSAGSTQKLISDSSEDVIPLWVVAGYLIVPISKLLQVRYVQMTGSTQLCYKEHCCAWSQRICAVSIELWF